MPTTAVLLLICSAGLHAAWNLISKRAVPSRAFFLLSDATAVLCLLPFLIINAAAVVAIPPAVWVLLAGTGACQAVYYGSLAAAYRRADLSVIYPLSRSYSSVLTVAIMIIIGKRDEIGDGLFVAILLILAGSYYLPRADFRHGTAVARAGLGWALLAAAGTAGYSVLDDSALRHLTEEMGAPLPYAGTVIIYGTLEGISTILWLTVSLALRGGFAAIGPLLRAQKSDIAFTGLATYASYFLVLAAMPLAQNISYVVGFRQLSVPLSVGAAIIFLREPAPLARILGATAMLAGVLLLGIS